MDGMAKPHKIEYSKKIVITTGAIFISQVILSNLFSWFNKDTSIFTYSIPTSGGIFGSSVAFYLNKAKMENVCKGKIKFFKFKMNYLSKHPERKEELEQDLYVIDNAIDSTVNMNLEQSMNEEINI